MGTSVIGQNRIDEERIIKRDFLGEDLIEMVEIEIGDIARGEDNGNRTVWSGS
jgi:hypothetical protein